MATAYVACCRARRILANLLAVGIQDMAERGLTMRLADEVNAAISTGTAERIVSGGALPTTPGSVSVEFDVSQSYPFITLVTMVAPSPDWFVGVSGVALFEQGEWAQERRVELAPWDAGTDSGATFTSPDLASSPHQPIAPIVTAPLSPGGRVTPLGTFTFTRIVNRQDSRVRTARAILHRSAGQAQRLPRRRAA